MWSLPEITTISGIRKQGPEVAHFGGDSSILGPDVHPFGLVCAPVGGSRQAETTKISAVTNH